MADWPPQEIAYRELAVAPAPDAARYSLRTRNPTGLPVRVLSSAPLAAGNALCLGPDEWLLLLPVGSAAPQVDGVHALTDISHRQVGIAVTGDRAAALVQCGCALDLSVAAFPPGKVTRTVYEGVEIVLWRRGDDRFHVEVWRSFAPYLWQALAQAAADR